MSPDHTGSEEGDAALARYVLTLLLVSFYRLPLQDREGNCTTREHQHHR